MYPLLLQGIVGQVLYVSEAWRSLCCCRALWLSAVCLGSMAGFLLLQGIVVECCMSQKHGRPSVVAGHCG